MLWEWTHISNLGIEFIDSKSTSPRNVYNICSYVIILCVKASLSSIKSLKGLNRKAAKATTSRIQMGCIVQKKVERLSRFGKILDRNLLRNHTRLRIF